MQGAAGMLSGGVKKPRTDQTRETLLGSPMAYVETVFHRSTAMEEEGDILVL
jgi:hypothetical protein